jgi:hypothetical protein
MKKMSELGMEETWANLSFLEDMSSDDEDSAQSERDSNMRWEFIERYKRE